jgi:tetratricopeptide (TPR) repeat protein
MNMTKSLTITVLLFCLSLNALAQVEVKGYALLYNNKSQGISGVTIMKENGQAETTDNKGFFNIKFSGELDRKQGRLKVLPPKSGVCKNYIVMEVDGYYYPRDINITIGRDNLVRISLCPPEEFEKMVLKLAKPYLDKELMAKNNRIEENKRLNLSNEELNKRLRQIEDEYKILKTNYMELAGKFVRIDPDFADENLKNARIYFEQGDIENAKKCLPEYDNAKSDIERGKAVMSLWLSIKKTEGDIYGVLQTYNDIEKYTGIEEDKFMLLKECSEYLFQNKIFYASFVKVALEYAEKAKKYAMAFLPIRYQISSYNLLGRIQKEQKEVNYYKSYDTAIAIYVEHKQDTLSRIEARKDIAISYTSRANYYKDRAKTQQAIGNYRKAMDIYIEMYNDEESDDINYLNMLINLATCYVEKRNDKLGRVSII